MNVILCSDEKGQGPQARLLPSKVLVLAKRRQISVGSFLRTMSPGPAQVSSLREPGTQPSWPLDSSDCPEARGARRWNWVPQTESGRGPLLLGHRGGLGRGSPRPEGLGQGQGAAAVGVVGSCRTEPQACSLRPPVHPLASGRGGGWDLPVTLLST